MDQKASPFRKTKRKGNRETKKVAILREAAKAFVEQGVHQTSLDDLAERLQVTKPALYYYVKNKEAVILECLAIGHKDDKEKIAEIRKSDASGWEKFKNLSRYYGNNVITDFGRCLVLIDLNSLSKDGQRKHRKSQRYIFEAARGFLEEGIKDKSVKPCNATVATLAIVGALNSIAHWYRESGPDKIDAIVEQILESFENGVTT